MSIISRTLFRPRDALQFVNECLATASNRERVSWNAIRSAEAIYSTKRLKSLQEEWGNIYPALSESVNLIRGLRECFTRTEITKERLESVCLSFNNEANVQDPCVISCKNLYQPGSTTTEAEVISEFLRCFYLVGIIGVKISALDSAIWSFIDQPRVSKSEIKRTNKIKIHKMLHHSLEIKVI